MLYILKGIQRWDFFFQSFQSTGCVGELTRKPFQALIGSAQHTIARQICGNDLIVIVRPSHSVQILLYYIQLLDLTLSLSSRDIHLKVTENSFQTQIDWIVWIVEQLYRDNWEYWEYQVYIPSLITSLSHSELRIWFRVNFS